MSSACAQSFASEANGAPPSMAICGKLSIPLPSFDTHAVSVGGSVSSAKYLAPSSGILR